MAFIRSLRNFSISASLIVALALMTLVASEANAQTPRVAVRVGDTTALPGDNNTVISVYMDNNFPAQDVITGFEISIRLGYSGVMEFKIDTVQEVLQTYFECVLPTDYVPGMECVGWIQVDTMEAVEWWQCQDWSGETCNNWLEVDSTLPFDSIYYEVTWDSVFTETVDVIIGNIDTTGTLCSGWEYLRVESSSGTGQGMTIYGFADDGSIPVNSGIAPQQGGLLFRLLADVYPMADVVTERTATIEILHEFYDQLSIVDADGNTMGIKYNEVEDTNFFKCLQWSPAPPPEDSICSSWVRVLSPDPDYDWFELETVLVPYFDSFEVVPIDGALTVLIPDTDEDGISDDFDNCPFIYNPLQEDDDEDGIGNVCETCCIGTRGNANDDPSGAVNISDVTFLVNYLFGIPLGPEPECREEANANGDVGELVNISDVTFLVDYLFGIPLGPPPTSCF